MADFENTQMVENEVIGNEAVEATETSEPKTNGVGGLLVLAGIALGVGVAAGGKKLKAKFMERKAKKAEAKAKAKAEEAKAEETDEAKEESKE